LDCFVVWCCVGFCPDLASSEAAEDGGKTFAGAAPTGSDDTGTIKA
jgi:hypothetical protein